MLHLSYFFHYSCNYHFICSWDCFVSVWIFAAFYNWIFYFRSPPRSWTPWCFWVLWWNLWLTCFCRYLASQNLNLEQHIWKYHSICFETIYFNVCLVEKSKKWKEKAVFIWAVELQRKKLQCQKIQKNAFQKLIKTIHFICSTLYILRSQCAFSRNVVKFQ